MAKKEATKFSYGVFDRKHIASIKKRLKAIDDLFDAAITQGARIGEASGFKDPDKPFYISDYPAVQERINDLMRSVGRGLQGVIETGDREEWLLSCEKNNAMVDAITSSTGLPKDVISQWKQPNLEALSSFQHRKEAGMMLSDRVWNITEQFKQELELALDLGLGEGKSAAALSRDVRKYLNEPNKLFRRVRDKHGVLRLSKAARAYHPGQGVYRSSYKNALRLTATENNIAYRMADSERWRQIPFVIGIRISISHNSHPVVDICDELQGEYPKDFVWTGWHPFCKCAAVAIRAKEEEFLDYQQKILAGEDVSNYKFSGTIEEAPDNFKGWVNDNAERIKNATKQPYFIRDNKKMVDEILADNKLSVLNDVIKKLDDAKVDYLPVKKLPKPLSENEIVSRVGGGDLTQGSCSSLAFAYAGNVCGFDVLDFRDGVSRSMFSRKSNIMDIAEKTGGFIVEHTDDFKKAKDLLKMVKEGQEYYFTCGSHAAIVRKTESGLEYLELQLPKQNGFKPLNTDVLKYRFGAKKSHTLRGRKYQTKGCLIDIDLLKGSNDFQKVLGYINTDAKKQRKGMGGSEK